MRTWKLFFVAVLAVLLVGCGDKITDDGLSSKEKAASSRLDQIAKASGGDWEKISQADRDFLINEISMGSEQSAKMLIQGKAGRLRATPGGK
jgi:hypothetical protein